MSSQTPKNGGRGSFSLGNVLLERGKHTTPGASPDHRTDRRTTGAADVSGIAPKPSKSQEADIGDIWQEQKRLREQDTLLEIEYRQAKEKAKRLKAQIKQNQIGDETLFGDELKKYMPKIGPGLGNRVADSLKQVGKAAKGIPARKLKGTRLTKRYAVLGGVLGLAILGLAVRPLIGGSNGSTGNNQDNPATLGQQTANGATAGLPEVENTEFELLYPAGVNPENVKVVKVNPENTATVYSYVDKLKDSQLRISQQRVPDSFQPNIDSSLEKTAQSFNANSVIYINGTKVYHGINQSGGTKQSLIFIKDDLLIFIASSQQLADEEWVAYISSMS